jgi:hypothetical protein
VTAQVTALVVGQNNREGLRLSVESLREHNRDVGLRVWYFDHDSTDGAAEWGRDHCDRVFRKTGPMGHHHGQALDLMVQAVTTPYALTLDNDVLSSGPTLARMIADLDAAGAFAAAPAAKEGMGEVDHFGRTLVGQPRIDPCFALFRADRLAGMTRRVSFSPYECTNLAKFYDTGGMVRAAAEGAGLGVLDLPWVWEAIRHYGSMTWASFAPPDSPVGRLYAERRKWLLDDLAAFDAAFGKDVEVVVARYAEPMDWTARLAPAKITVYDKSEYPLPGTTPLPNVGREAHTYAEHVARRYDDLAAVTVFTQGRPFDHAPDLATAALIPTARFTPHGPHRLETDHDGGACHPGLPVGRTYEELTGRPFPGTALFAPGAVFSAHRETLRAYPRDWWRRLADLLAAPHTQTWGAWTMERLWAVVLTAER